MRVAKRISGLSLRSIKVAVLVLGITALAGYGRAEDVGKPVQTLSGLVTGIKRAGSQVTAYKGIPYAAPPVRELRWRPPQPVAPWKGVRSADHFAASCMQKIHGEHLPWTRQYMAQNPISEDCLYLNVWTSATGTTLSALRPVLVWIHGGGFIEGAASPEVYDGEELAKRGVVFVSINYRLGVFGFLAHPELTGESLNHASGNYGLLDAIAALNWVQKNIRAFGGDPNCVTIAGQSSGAAAVIYLTASPLAKGLFQRAIIESGAYKTPPLTHSLQDAEKHGMTFARISGAHTLKELRALNADELLKIQTTAGIRLRPNVDGNFLPQTIAEIFAAGRQNDVPTMTGQTADEGSTSPTYGKISAANYASAAKKTYGPQFEEYIKLYPGRTDKEAGESQKASIRDLNLVAMSMWAEDRAATARTASFTYFFDRAIPWPDHPEFGAFHSAEIPYALGNLGVLDRPFEAADYALERVMSEYWLQFVRTGDPNAHGLPVWPAFSKGVNSTMELGVTVRPRPVASDDVFRFWKNYLARLQGFCCVPGR